MRRLDRRRWVIPAMLGMTVIAGYVLSTNSAIHPDIVYGTAQPPESHAMDADDRHLHQQFQ